MNWLNAFELMCYFIVTFMLIDLIRKKDYNSLFTFCSAALVGFAMELLAVSVTDIYYYNNEFWLSLGVPPHQFPLFGGFMWGGLTVYGIKLAQKLQFGKILTSLSAGMIIVTMDILLDVVAIRLDGGFWTWVGNPIELTVSAASFFSVIWVNFLGYMIETPAVTYFTLKKREKIKEKDWKRQVIFMFLIALGGIVITGIGSLLALGLNIITNQWFACIAFLILWLVMVVIILRRIIILKMTVSKIKKWNIPMVIFWVAMYTYCLAAIVSLEIHTEKPWFMIMGIAFFIGTLYLCISDSEHEIDKNLHNKK